MNAKTMAKMLNLMDLLRLFMVDNRKLRFILYFCNQNILQRYEFIPEFRKLIDGITYVLRQKGFLQSVINNHNNNGKRFC